MELFTKSAQDTQKLGEKIADTLTGEKPSSVILGRSETTTPESGFWTHPAKTGFARMTGKTKGKVATVLALHGELGSGKTTFTQGFVKALGLPDRVVSPTFILVREYPLKVGRFFRLYHIDLYRLDDPKIDDLGLNEIFADPTAIVVIEWAERLGEQLPTPRIEMRFEHISDTERKIVIREI